MSNEYYGPCGNGELYEFLGDAWAVPHTPDELRFTVNALTPEFQKHKNPDLICVGSSAEFLFRPQNRGTVYSLNTGIFRGQGYHNYINPDWGRHSQGRKFWLHHYASGDKLYAEECLSSGGFVDPKRKTYPGQDRPTWMVYLMGELKGLDLRDFEFHPNVDLRGGRVTPRHKPDLRVLFGR